MKRRLLRLVVMVAALFVVLTPADSPGQELCSVIAECGGFCLEWGEFFLFKPQNTVTTRCCGYISSGDIWCTYRTRWPGCCYWLW